MKNAALLTPALLSSLITAILIVPFQVPAPELGFISNDVSLTNTTHHEFFKRADNCPNGYGSCAYMGQPSFCCKGTSNCGTDNVGHVACCPVGAVCTGTIGGSFATVSNNNNAGTTTTAAAQTTVVGLVPATQATGEYSVVQNPYYPFKAIPTTYADQRGCSAAWTGCQSDMARCTAYLQGGSIAGEVVTGNGGVTISAPNGGITVNGGAATLPQATITMAPAQASSICSSLSLAGCSGLQVTACSVFGGGNAARRACGGYGAVAGGAAIGLAGQMLWG